MERTINRRLAAVLASAQTGAHGLERPCAACGRHAGAGPLCTPCVRAARFFGGDPRVVESAAGYLERTAIAPAIKDRLSFEEDEWEAVYTSQDGHCAACGTESGRSLVTDHDPVAGTVRGLVCRRCRWGIASLADDPERARRLAQRLRADLGQAHPA